jgi:hypothetical protein
MRTTIDFPDALFRKTKATAALRGTTMKELVLKAVEREVAGKTLEAKQNGRRVKLPVMQWAGKKKLDLSNFDFDDLLS